MNDGRNDGSSGIMGALKSSSPDFPLITIITVVLNGGRYVEQAIQSVINQDYPHLEYIIIDGGSTDETVDIIRKYEDRIDRWTSEPDNGIYDAMNKGIALARGELIGLLNADDYYEPNALQAVAKAYSASRATGIFYGNSYILQDDMGLRYKSYGHTRFWRGMGFSHQAMFVHWEVHNIIGSYGTGYRIAGDYDFVIRALEAGISFSYVDAFLVNFRTTGLSSSNLYASLNENRRINRNYFGLLSMAHMGFMLLFAKSCLLLVLEKILGFLCGKRILAWSRMLYMKNIIIKGHSRR